MKWILASILFPVKMTFLMDKMVLLLGKLITYRNLMMFIEHIAIFAIESILQFVTRKIATVIKNHFITLVEKVSYFFKKKNPDVPNWETMV